MKKYAINDRNLFYDYIYLWYWILIVTQIDSDTEILKSKNVFKRFKNVNLKLNNVKKIARV